MNIVNYLKSKGLKDIVTEANGREHIMSPCPFCDKVSTKKKRHFYVNEDGACHCKVCGEGANIFQLKKKYGDLQDWREKNPNERTFRNSNGKVVAKWSGKNKKKKKQKGKMMLTRETILKAHEFLLSDHAEAKRSLAYLTSRGFILQTINHFKIGLIIRAKCKIKTCKFYGVPKERMCPKCGSEMGGRRWYLSFPYFDGQELTLVKYRSLPPDKRFERETDGVTDLFNKASIKGSSQAVIVESETDAISIHQLGVTTIVSLPAGAGAWDEEWNQYFIDTESIYLALDTDNAGNEGVEKISSALGAFRCYRVIWPEGIKDANDFLSAGATPEDMKKLLEEAPSVGSKVWMTADDLADSLRKRIEMGDAVKGTQTKWKEFDEIIGGVRDSELILVTGDTGSGKSMFTTAIALRLMKQGLPTVIGSFEVSPEDTLQRITQQLLEKDWAKIQSDPDVFNSGIEQLTMNPLYFLNLHGAVEIETLKNILRWGVVRFGIKVIVLDHLHYFLPEAGTERERFSIDRTMRMLKSWTKEWGVNIILVVHPNSKLMVGGRVGLDSLKGSTEIKKEADVIIAIYRARGYELSVKATGISSNTGATECRIIKCRSQFGSEGNVWFFFNTKTLTYTTITQDEADNVAYLDGEWLKKLYTNQLGQKKKASKNIKNYSEKGPELVDLPFGM